MYSSDSQSAKKMVKVQKKINDVLHFNPSYFSLPPNSLILFK